MDGLKTDKVYFAVRLCDGSLMKMGDYDLQEFSCDGLVLGTNKRKLRSLARLVGLLDYTLVEIALGTIQRKPSHC